MIRNLLLSILFLAVIFLGLEALLRTTHLFGARISWSIPDPVLGWRFAPSRDYWFLQENDHPVAWRTNRFGWKDKDWSIDKPLGTFRIAVLGDSYVEALQIESEKNFLSLAEKELHAKGRPKFELMNFGRSAFTQTEELIVLREEVLRFSPDLVVLFFFPPNDIDEVKKETALDPIRPFFEDAGNGSLQLDTRFQNLRTYKIKSLISPLKHHSALVSLLTERFTLFQFRQRAKTKEGPHPRTSLPGYLSLATAHPDPQYELNYQWNKRLITEMVFFLRRRGIRFLLISMDLPAYVPLVEKEYKAKDPSFNANFFDEDLKSFAAALGADFLGLERIFRETYLKTGRPLHFQYWNEKLGKKSFEYAAHTGHWNYQGHQTLAQALIAKLEEMKVAL